MIRVVQYFFLVLSFLLYQVASAAPVEQVSLAPFSTDGCSAFPDGTLFQPHKWCRCCVEHDRAYWQGGTREERAQADKAFQACIRQAQDKVLAKVMYWGVRLGGCPYYHTSYRWGYGWSQLRGYQALTAEELTQVQQQWQTPQSQAAYQMCSK